MKINITIFNRINVVDSCAVWNVLSSNLIYTKAIDCKCDFSFTKFVEYECLFKERRTKMESDIEIQNRLRREMKKGKFQSHSLSIEDIQELQLLNARKKFGMGELSSIAFAKKINQSFLTDDQPARKFASNVLGTEKVQTTPQLVGYLFYTRAFIDGELEEIIREHRKFNRPLEVYFREVYSEALRIRLVNPN